MGALSVQDVKGEIMDRNRVMQYMEGIVRRRMTTRVGTGSRPDRPMTSHSIPERVCRVLDYE